MNRFAPLAVLLPVIAIAAADEKEEQLIDAARRGDLEVVKQLVAGGADVNAKSHFNITPLWKATSKGHFETVEFLLEAGADPNIHDEVWKATPLMLSDNSEIVGLLVKHGADGVDSRLRLAALNGAMKIVRAIVDAKRLDEQTLAAAKAQAEVGAHPEIAKLLDDVARKNEVAGSKLPGPPEIDADALRAYVGKYSGDRLEEAEVSLNDGKLTFKTSGGSALRMIPRDERTFDMGPYTAVFQVQGGKTTGLISSSPTSRRTYTPVLASDAGASPLVADVDDWTLDNDVAAKNNWASFRGPAARGIAVYQDLPDTWDVEKGRGVRWKTAIAGLANSCPIVWKDKVFVTTAVSSAGNTKLRIGLYGAVDAADDESNHSWRLYCLDHASGRILWHRVAHEGKPPVKRHLKSSQANSTPVTDGKHVVALFNSGGLYCYDMDGKLLWEKQLGVLDSGAFNDVDYQWGFGSSPIIYRGSVIVQCDIQKDSFLAAFETASGKEIWRVPRDEIPSWGTPTIHETARLPLLITNATNHVRGYDARTGRELWKLSRNAAITVPTPIVAHDLIYVTSGYRPIQPIYAVRLSAQGDITLAEGELSSEHIAWSKARGGPYLPTPLLYGNYLYTCANSGILTCYEAKTGKQIYRRRCGSGSARSFTASPVAADGKIYVTAESGDVMTIKAGPKFEVLGKNSLGEYCLSTPAIAGGLLLMRTQKHLVAVGAETEEGNPGP